MRFDNLSLLLDKSGTADRQKNGELRTFVARWDINIRIPDSDIN